MGERPTPDAPHPGRRRPPRAPSCRPHSAQNDHAGVRALGLVTGPHARTPRTHSQWVVGPGRTPERTSDRGRESAQPRTPHTQARVPPPGTHMPPPQRPKLPRKSTRCGVVDGSPRPHPPRPKPLGSGPRPHARKDEWWGVGERRTPEAPHPGKRRPPRVPSCRPYSAQSQRARPARKSARNGVGDGSPGPHPPHGECAAPSQVGRNGTGLPPPKQAKRSMGLRQDTRRGADRVEGPHQRPAPGPREVRAPHQPGEGGGADAARAGARTHTKNTRGKPERQPDRARGTHRPHGMAYQRARIRDTQTGRPATHSAGNAGRAGGNRKDTTPGTGPSPPEPAASAAHTRPGHCTRQGSSGT